MKKYWLIKSEGDCYSIDDLEKDTLTPWSGVRNFQARNFMRDIMKVGDLAFFYHSNSKHAGIYGIAEVCSTPYADPTALEPKDEHFDSVSYARFLTLKKEFVPTWVLVDFKFVKKFKKPMLLNEIKLDPSLEGMVVRNKGSRLSIQPVSEKHFKYICSVLR